ncbi:Related to ATPase family protein [Taphrina deformans PYCC 5710]|uniref:Related to ATPase family protein n=1 Tax=Taphrina deformans (strain PYCC 5710 / ATCC 11124 / CBS 356.35 / IMI 108563 / JCM 9778 / NBRC 8474) TaxID=1097556 RepID=R4XBP7_TAPDE|nr:Related to ATPase family protein [Taphrina deformans PYCC 5710]|eukprot:CCG80758.1 Related to ATPase family protein [Taphrina deformans PYCC 5710]
MSDPFLHYQSLVNVNYFRKDESQLRAAKELQKLYRRIDGYVPPIDFARKIKQVEKLLRNQESDSALRKYITGASDKSLVKQLSWEEELLNIDSPRGLMLSGSVGSGKSMLIDTLLPMKKRWHYNAFMLELFARLNRERDDEYILLKIAYELIEESPILAIDEFQLGDPASARILKGILVYFWKMGGVLVATSNRMPEDLYSGSFQAEQFKSFTELLGTRCVVHDMRSTRDFRKEVEDQLAYYHTTDAEQSAMDQHVRELLPHPSETFLSVYSRKLRVPAQSKAGVAHFDFKYICEQDFGSADYISIASRYHTIILDQIPVLTLQKKNEARRFISLIDALYEAKCKLLIRAASTPDGLFFPDSTDGKGDGDSIASEAFSETYYDVTTPNRPNVSAYAAADGRHQRDTAALADLHARQDFSKLNAFTGQDEQFAFRRAASRLFEMTSREWWTKVRHEPNDESERRWEAKQTSMPLPTKGPGVLDFRHNASSPFRTHPKPPPKFGMEHFWAMVTRSGERKKTNPDDWLKRG